MNQCVKCPSNSGWNWRVESNFSMKKDNDYILIISFDDKEIRFILDDQPTTEEIEKYIEYSKENFLSLKNKIILKC